ncbi:MAG: serine/threonine-protein kinase [Sedimentisphaerales bacterium]|nr:serine/threonine-protein kinase [Sedimentisphaerales bacterium]
MATYSYVGKIGSGGFGEVWKVRRKDDDILFALKRLVSDDTESVERFTKEVRLISSLDHPYIVKIVGKRLDRTANFYVMPLYRTSLKEELSLLKSDEQRIIKIFTAILDAIEYAHAQGVIHRDIKPENILLNNDDDLVITDFGLGRKITSASTRITTTSDNLGTFFYIAPEQALSMRTCDHRADIYSLGKLLYEMYTDDQFCWDIDQLSPAIQMIVNRCTRRNPEERFESVTELRQVWNGLFSSKKKANEIHDFNMLRMLQSIDKNQANQLLALFLKNAGESDALHEAVMNTEPEAFRMMYLVNQAAVRSLLKKFAEFTANQGWGFDYTDRIASVCAKLVRTIEDFQIKTDLIICLLEVGYDHNRWHVLSVCAKLIGEIIVADEAVMLSSKLVQIPEHKRSILKPYLKTIIFPEIAQLFS